MTFSVLASTYCGVSSTRLIDTRVSGEKPVPLNVTVDDAASSPKLDGVILVSVNATGTVLNVATNSGITSPMMPLLPSALPLTTPDQPGSWRW